jgi:hypothetical protein
MQSPELDEAIEQLKRTSIPPGPSDTLKASTALALSRAAGESRRSRRPLRYLAIAAGVLLLLGAGFFFFMGGDSPTFAQVVQQVEKTKTLQGINHEPGMYDLPFYIKGNLQRWEGNNPFGPIHWITIADRATGEEFRIYPEQKRIERERANQLFNDLYSMIREVAEHPVQALGEQVIDGRKLVGYLGQMKSPEPSGRTVLVPVRIWVDPKTKLPVRIEYIDTTTGKPSGGLSDLRFDEPIDDALFAMKVPEGTAVDDRRGDPVVKLRPPPTTQEAARLVVRPGVGIGDVKVGDSPAKVIAVLGEPEVKGARGGVNSDWDYSYPSLGIRLFLRWDDQRKEPAVKTIYADAARITTPSLDFLGATDRGIRLGSTRKEVEAIYGKPAWENKQNADYRKLGLSVTYAQDGVQVAGFIVLKPSDEPIFFIPEEHANELPAATTQTQPSKK